VTTKIDKSLAHKKYIRACDDAGGMAQFPDTNYWIVDADKYEVREKEDG
jgi:hypothetical protein